MVSFGVTVNFSFNIHRSKVGLAFHKQARLTAGVRGYKVGGGGMVEVFLGGFDLLIFSPLLVFFCLVRVERQVQAEKDRG